MFHVSLLTPHVFRFPPAPSPALSPAYREEGGRSSDAPYVERNSAITAAPCRGISDRSSSPPPSPSLDCSLGHERWRPTPTRSSASASRSPTRRWSSSEATSS